MLCKVNYQDNEEGKIDETIDAQMNSVKNQLQKEYTNISFRE